MGVASQPPQYSEDIFVKREGLWRIGGFVKQGLRGLYLPQKFVDDQHLKEVFGNAVQDFYWSGISRLVSQPMPAYAADFGNIVQFSDRYRPGHHPLFRGIQFEHSGTNPSSPPPKQRVSKLLLAGLGISALGALAGLSIYLHSMFSQDEPISSSPNQKQVISRLSPQTWIDRYGNPKAFVRNTFSYKDEPSLATAAEVNISDIVVADLHSDGNLDEIVLMDVLRDDYFNTLTLLLVYENGKLKAYGSLFPEHYSKSSLIVTDFTGDKKSEIAVMLASSSDFAGAKLRSAGPYPTKYKLHILHWNNDSIGEVNNSKVGEIKSDWRYDIYGNSISIIDLDNNGRLDIVTKSLVCSSTPVPSPSAIADYTARTLTRQARELLSRCALALDLKRFEWDPKAPREYSSGRGDYVNRDVPRSVKLAGTVEFLSNNPNVAEAQNMLKDGLITTPKPFLMLSYSELGRHVGNDVLAEAMTIFSNVDTRRPELVATAAEAILRREDPSKEIAKALNSDQYVGKQIFVHDISPAIFTVDAETRKIEPLELTLYDEAGEFKGILPYKKDIVLIFDPEAQKLAVKYGLYLGRDNRLGIDINFTTTAGDLEARRLPATSLVFVDDKKVVDRAGMLYQRAQEGSITPYEFLRETNSIRKDLGIVPSIDETMRDLQTVAKVVEVVSKGGKPEDLINTFVGTPKERDEFKDYLNFVGAILAGKTPPVLGNK